MTIRLLDPPLHEFLPDRYEVRDELKRAELEFTWDLPELQLQAQLVRGLEESNPMLGTRGVRVGILYPDIYEMQVRAILRAAQAVHAALGHAARRGDHDPARRLRARARADARHDRADRRRDGAGGR